MNMLQISLVLTLVTFINSKPLTAHEIGNGAGSWVCRENDGAIRWAELVDLFEAQSEFALDLEKYSGKYQDILIDIQKKVYQINEGLYWSIDAELRAINNLRHNPPKIIYTRDKLEITNDSLYRIKPRESRCKGGVIRYEQVINFKNDGNIIVQQDLFEPDGTNGFSELAKAAAVYHEAVYSYRRVRHKDKNSVATRKIIGLLFSNLDKESIKSELALLGEVDMSFVVIKPGTFLMGTEKNETYYYYNEYLHPRTISIEFEIMATEVTQLFWYHIMGTLPSFHRSFNHCPDTFRSIEVSGKKHGICPNHPVEGISKKDIDKFIDLLQRSPSGVHYHYRLPTEVEWEYALRAGTETIYYFGEDVQASSQYEWTEENAQGHTHEVGQLKANLWGLFDMGGNVQEIVSDHYSTWYQDHPNGGPSSPVDSVSRDHVIRGSSFLLNYSMLRSGGRTAHSYLGDLAPAVEFQKKTFGFRLVRTKKQKSTD